MKIAVSGASGFIGGHVLAELARRQVDTIAIGRHRVEAGERPVQGKWVELDLHACPGDVFDQIGRPDALIHLAWGGLPNYRSLHHFEVELPAQYRFLRMLVESGLSSLVVTGTCFEYGMQSGELTEAHPARPDNPYALAKDTLRRQLEFLQARSPHSLSWARLFYLHGEGQAESSLLPQLKRAVAAGQKHFDMSGGEQLRDYLPVTEVARVLVDLAINKSNAGVVNVSSGEPVSVRRLVEGWIDRHEWDISLNLGHYPYPDYEPMAFWGSRAKLDACLRAGVCG